MRFKAGDTVRMTDKLRSACIPSDAQGRVILDFGDTTLVHFGGTLSLLGNHPLGGGWLMFEDEIEHAA